MPEIAWTESLGEHEAQIGPMLLIVSRDYERAGVAWKASATSIPLCEQPLTATYLEAAKLEALDLLRRELSPAVELLGMGAEAERDRIKLLALAQADALRAMASDPEMSGHERAYHQLDVLKDFASSLAEKGGEG